MVKAYIEKRIALTKKIGGIRIMSPGQLMQFLSHEGLYKKGKCLMCGAPVKGRRTTYCSEKCAYDVFSYYNQDNIRTRLINERGRRCEIKDCDMVWTTTFPDESLELHHKIPIHDGGTTFDDDNLILLCTKHHGEAHRAYNDKKREAEAEVARKITEEKKEKMKEYWSGLV